MQLSVQYVQIYQEQLTDLISGNPVTLRQRADRAELHGCSEHEIHSMDDVLHLLSIGEERKVSLSLSPRLSLVSHLASFGRMAHDRRAALSCVPPQIFAATKMNDHSSRAHTIFILSASQISLGARDGAARLSRSQLHLVDLAGCEQLKQSEAEGQNRREAIGINFSLMVGPLSPKYPYPCQFTVRSNPAHLTRG